MTQHVKCMAVKNFSYRITKTAENLQIAISLNDAVAMCGVKLKDRLPSKELRERLGVDDIALLLQQNRLRWYGHLLLKDDDDWVKKCMEYEAEGSRPRGRPKKAWKEVVHEDCQAHKLNKEDAMDRCKWRKVIKEAR